MKKKTTARVISQKELTPGIFDLWLETELAESALPGQFVGVYTNDASKLLPRPISICQTKKMDSNGVGALRLVYRITGQNTGTEQISKLKTDNRVKIIGVLGNGYDISCAEGKNVVLMGGGIGIPPMLELAIRLQGRARIVAGYRNAELFLKEDLEKAGKLYIATEDGSVGVKGNVLDLMKKEKLPCDIIMACGPMPMLKAIAAYGRENNIKVYVSLEERMACGVGACLGCITATKDIDAHSHVYNTRICTEGPVFDADILKI